MKSAKVLVMVVAVLGTALTVGAETHVVTVSNFEFSPAQLTVGAGDLVRWEFTQGSHTTTSGIGSADPQAGVLWNSGLLGARGVFQRQFNQAGVFLYFCIPHESFGMRGSIVVEEPLGFFQESDAVPEAYFLAQNYPNPFNPSTAISFGLESGGFTTVTVYNLIGQVVTRLEGRDLPAGDHQVVWDGRDRRGVAVPSGIYFYRLLSGEFGQVRKMILLR